MLVGTKINTLRAFGRNDDRGWKKLTGQVGEHLVSAVLGTLGHYASPYSGNVPGFGFTAVNSESLNSGPVQVKTNTTGALVQSSIDKWCEHSTDENNYQSIGELNIGLTNLTPQVNPLSGKPHSTYLTSERAISANIAKKPLKWRSIEP